MLILTISCTFRAWLLQWRPYGLSQICIENSLTNFSIDKWEWKTKTNIIKQKTCKELMFSSEELTAIRAQYFIVHILKMFIVNWPFYKSWKFISNSSRYYNVRWANFWVFPSTQCYVNVLLDIAIVFTFSASESTKLNSLNHHLAWSR